MIYFSLTSNTNIFKEVIAGISEQVISFIPLKRLQIDK